MGRLLDYLPRGEMVDDASWRRRHLFLVGVLAGLSPALLIFGLALGNPTWLTLVIAAIPAGTATAGALSTGRRAGSLWVTGGLTACCAGLVILSGGSIEAHFSFFVIIGFLTLYQHWLPFVWNIGFTVLSHGLGSLLVPTMIFNHHAGQHSPWMWSLIHGVAVLFACAGVMVFCRITEREQAQRAELAQRLADSEVAQQEFTSQLLLNLARRNQSMYGRQLDIINDLEERERDPDVLSDLFRLDHLATRVRRNAESLLVLSGETSARVWTKPVALRDVVRAGIAETEDLERVSFTVDEHTRVVGGAVADLTHVIAELVENAARFSPPTSNVRVTGRAHHRIPGAQLLVVEDTGVGMPASDRDAANELLRTPRTVDLAASRRLGFHVVSRLAARHGIDVSLTTTPGGGVTAVLSLPAELFAESEPVEQLPTAQMRVPAEAVLTGAPSPSPAAASTPGTNGRHSWPGHSTEPDDDTGGLATDTGADGDDGDEDAAADDVPGRHTVDGRIDADTVPAETGPPPGDAPGRRGLIHPVVVPPPRFDPGSPDASRPGPPAPRAPVDDPSSTTPRGAATGPTAATATEPAASDGVRDAPVLRRRVPQTHLAPELMRTNGSDDGTAAVEDPAAPVPAAGPLDALSNYQASRAAARDALDVPGGEPADGGHAPRPTGGRA